MKKLIVSLMTLLLLSTCIPMQLMADVTPYTMVTTKAAGAAEAEALLSRLNEIKAMDKSNLSSSEKKQLRKEVREIKSNLKNNNNGIYLSVGAVIIIILLLILLL